MIRIRVKKKKSGPNIFEDKRVSLFAKGIFAQAVALKSSRDIKELFALVPDAVDSIYKGIMELRKFGYCKRVKIDEITEFRFILTPSCDTARVKNKESLLYSKEGTQVDVRPTQSRSSEVTQGVDDFADWDEIDPAAGNSGSVSQPTFFKDRVKPSRVSGDLEIPRSSHKILYRICFMIETDAESSTLYSSDRGRVASALGKLAIAGADFSQIHKFESWWSGTWRSKDKAGAYQPPTPEQVVQFWFQAMKSKGYKPMVPEGPKHVEVDLTAIMRDRANTRHG